MGAWREELLLPKDFLLAGGELRFPDGEIAEPRPACKKRPWRIGMPPDSGDAGTAEVGEGAASVASSTGSMGTCIDDSGSSSPDMTVLSIDVTSGDMSIANSASIDAASTAAETLCNSFEAPSGAATAVWNSVASAECCGCSL